MAEFGMNDLKRMAHGPQNGEPPETHVHELPNGTLTGKEVEGQEGFHMHEYANNGRTGMSDDAPDHTHETPEGETSGPK